MGISAVLRLFRAQVLPARSQISPKGSEKIRALLKTGSSVVTGRRLRNRNHLAAGGSITRIYSGRITSTVEDPIVVASLAAVVVNNREVRHAHGSVLGALRGRLARGPDIIASAKMRDLETIDLALTAAATATWSSVRLHTPNAPKTTTYHRCLPAGTSRTRFALRSAGIAQGRGRAEPLPSHSNKAGPLAALEISVVVDTPSQLIARRRRTRFRHDAGSAKRREQGRSTTPSRTACARRKSPPKKAVRQGMDQKKSSAYSKAPQDGLGGLGKVSSESKQ